MNKDYYTILGIKDDASQDDIKKAYRKLAHKHHPDKTGGDDMRFKEINEAYYVLSDTSRRKHYDQFGVGTDVKTDRGDVHGPGFDGFTEGFETWFQDILDQFGFGDFGFDVPHSRTRGHDLGLEITITLPQVFKGLIEDVPLTHWMRCKRCTGSGAEPGSTLTTCATCSGAGKLHRVEQTFFGTMTRLVICPKCSGAGELPEEQCTTCKGSGREKRQERIAIQIPPGVEDGQTIVLKGAGDVPEHPTIGKQGSLYVTVRVETHPRFKREGDDLWLEEEILFTTLVGGGTVEIEAIDGSKLRVKIPKATPSGKVFRVAGKGLPHQAKRGGKGNLYITVHARVPERPSRRLIEKLKELSDEL